MTSQKEYLKKYISENVKDIKRKKKKDKLKTSNENAFKRSKIIDDDIDLKSLRPLGDDELELYQMDEDAPQIAGIIDERPEEVKAQEFYNSKRWKVFGGDNGVNVVDSLDKKLQSAAENPCDTKDFGIIKRDLQKYKITNGSNSNDIDNLPIQNDKHHTESSRRQSQNKYPQGNNEWRSKSDDSDLSPPRNYGMKRKNYDSDQSPPRRERSNKYREDHSSSDAELSRKKSKIKTEKSISPSRKEKKRLNYGNGSDMSPGKKHNRGHSASDSDNSPPRMSKGRLFKHDNSADAEPRVKNRIANYDIQHGKYSKTDLKRIQKCHSSDSNNSTPPNKKQFSYNRNYSPSRAKNHHLLRSVSPPRKQFPSSNLLPSGKSSKNVSPRLSRKDLMYEKNVKQHFSDSDDSPPRRRRTSSFHKKSNSDTSPPRKPDNPKVQKKKLYLPNGSSSSEENSRSKSKKMKITLDGKQAGLQDAKQLRKELSDLKMKEDVVFSKMDASVSGFGSAAIQRDRKTGQIRDLEKEKEIQKEKEAKASIVNEKYNKWGKGLKQVEDAKERAAEALKEMNKPLARYANDEDLDNFLKAQEREGDPMLDYIKQKQKEATPLVGEKPTYQGPYNPNRFGIRPGHRWDGVVRSNGFEKEWFSHQNARKARDEEAYKWSTSDM